MWPHHKKIGAIPRRDCPEHFIGSSNTNLGTNDLLAESRAHLAEPDSRPPTRILDERAHRRIERLQKARWFWDANGVR